VIKNTKEIKVVPFDVVATWYFTIDLITKIRYFKERTEFICFIMQSIEIILLIPALKYREHNEVHCKTKPSWNT